MIPPGEMKTLLNKVIEAEKAAAANVILRREDAAATRNMANTAKVIAENPVLMRLKELETMKDIAEKIDEIKLVMGTDGLRGLLPYAGGLNGRDRDDHREGAPDLCWQVNPAGALRLLCTNGRRSDAPAVHLLGLCSQRQSPGCARAGSARGTA